MTSIADATFRQLAEQMSALAHSQRGLAELLQGMALPVFDDRDIDTSANANPTVITVTPKGRAPLQVVRSIIYSTTTAASTLTLGDRIIPIANAEIRVLAPLWMLLRPADKRQLSIPAAATNGFLELMGYEVPNTVISEFMFRLHGA
jgi:hypothetical protein